MAELRHIGTAPRNGGSQLGRENVLQSVEKVGSELARPKRLLQVSVRGSITILTSTARRLLPTGSNLPFMKNGKQLETGANG